jgi:hypothetical protein
MPDRVRLRDSLIPETARLIRDQQSLRWGLTLRRATAATIAKRFSALALPGLKPL